MTIYSRLLFHVCHVVVVFLCCAGVQAAVAAKGIAAPIPYQKMSFLHYLAGADSTRLSMPTDVAVDGNAVYVVDGANHRIVVFSLKGRVLYTFGGKGHGQGKLDSPVGLTIYKDKIYVADTGNKLIQIFARDGHFIRQFKVLSRGKAIRPIDIAVSKDGREYYVSGNRNHRLMVFSAAGKLLREWGGDGLNPGQFRFPGAVLVLPDSRIAVVDVLNTRVQVFEKDGTFSVQVGEWGVLPGQLFRPKGVAVDANNNFYISDSYMDVIQVYDSRARFKYVLQPENMTYKPITPAGITIDRQGRLYIAEVLKNRVSVFQLHK